MDFAIYQRESAKGIYVSLHPEPLPPPSLPYPSLDCPKALALGALLHDQICTGHLFYT